MQTQTLAFLHLWLHATCHVTYPGRGSIYGSQQGLFVPAIHEIKNVENAGDVLYTKFCKAICYLYVPIERTCGLNNKIYENDCQARCDRVGTDKSRLKFNGKCCCPGGSHLVDASFAAGQVDGPPALAGAATCVHIIKPAAAGGQTNYLNIFAIPPCLARCLDIDSKNDLEYADKTLAYIDGCSDNLERR